MSDPKDIQTPEEETLIGNDFAQADEPEEVSPEEIPESENDPEAGPETETGPEAEGEKTPDGEESPEAEGAQEGEIPPKQPKPSTGGTHIEIGEAGNVTNVEAEKFEQVNNEVKNFFFYGKEESDGKNLLSRVSLSAEHFTVKPFTELILDLEIDSFIRREGLTLKIASKINKSGLILLQGPADHGKGMLAFELANYLVSEKGQKKIYVKSGLPKGIFFNIKSLLSEKEFQNSILIFKDCLTQRNQSVLNIFQSKEELREIGKKLAKAGTYLIFTSDEQACIELLENYQNLEVVFEVPRIPEERLSAEFGKIVTKVLRGQTFTSEQKERYRSVLAENQYEILRRIDKVSLIYKFLNRLCQKSYLSDLELDKNFIKEELDKFNNLSDWFVKELAGSEIHWLWGISLVLAHCAPDLSAIPYNLFETLRKSLFHIFVEENLIEDENVEAKILRSENSLIEKFQAEVVSDFTTRARAIKFKDGNYVLNLWKVLFDKFWTTLHRLHPHLIHLAETQDIGFSSFMYFILGRMSIGFPAETEAMVLNWTQSDTDDFRKELSLGFLYVGILATDDKKHIDRFLNHLVNIRKRSEQGVIAAIGAYAQIGAFRLKPSVKALGDILKRRFGKTIESQNKISKVFDRYEQEIRKRVSTHRELKQFEAFRNLNRFFIKAIFNRNERDYEIVTSVQYSLVNLCLTLDAASVFKELNKWLIPGQETTRILLNYMFLGTGGIADELMKRNYTIKGYGEDKLSFSCNHINYSLLLGEDSIRDIARFYANLMRAIYLLPTYTRRVFRRILLRQLQKLAKNSTQIPLAYNPCVLLYIELMFLSKELKEEIKSFMEYEFDAENEKLHEFRKEVRKGFYKRSLRG